MSELIKLRNLYNTLNEMDNAKANLQREAERRVNATEIGRKYREKEEELNIARKKVNSLVDKIISPTLKISFIATIVATVISFILAIVYFPDIGMVVETKAIDKVIVISSALIIASVLMAGLSFCCGMIWIDNKQFSDYFSTLMVCWLIIGGIAWAGSVVMTVILEGFKVSVILSAILLPLIIIFMLILHIFSPQDVINAMAPLFWRFMLISVIMMVILAVLLFLLIKLGERKGKIDSNFKKIEKEFSRLEMPYLDKVGKCKADLEPMYNYSLKESESRWRNEVRLYKEKKEEILEILRCIERREAETIEGAKQWIELKKRLERINGRLGDIGDDISNIRKNTDDIKDNTRDIERNVDSMTNDLSSIRKESKKVRNAMDDINRKID